MRHIGDDPTVSTHATKETVKVTLTVTSESSHGISSANKEGYLTGWKSLIGKLSHCFVWPQKFLLTRP